MMKKLTFALALTGAFFGTVAADEPNAAIERGLTNEDISHHAWAYLEAPDQGAYLKQNRISQEDRKRMQQYMQCIQQVEEDMENDQQGFVRRLVKELCFFGSFGATIAGSALGLNSLAKVRPTTTMKQAALLTGMSVPIAALLLKLQHGKVGTQLKALKKVAADALFAKQTARYEEAMEKVSKWYATYLNMVNAILGFGAAGGLFACNMYSRS